MTGGKIMKLVVYAWKLHANWIVIIMMLYVFVVSIVAHLAKIRDASG